MARVAWIRTTSDPWRSGAARQLGIPALLCEEDGWISEFVSVHEADRICAADVVVLPLGDIDALPTLACLSPPPRIVIEVDTLWAIKPLAALAALKAVENRVAGVVAREPRVAALVRKACAELPIQIIPDIAARAAELLAVQMRFELRAPPSARPELEPGFELWFSEPGDLIDDDEIAEIVSSWSATAGRKVVVAPEEIRLWLVQLGLKFEGYDWSAATLQHAIGAAARCVFFGSESYSQSRRRALALRSGGAAVPPRALAAAALEPMSVGGKWRALLRKVSQPRPPALKAGPAMIFLDLVQDLDLLLPLIDQLTAMGVPLRVMVSSWLQKRSPRVGEALQKRGLPLLIYDRSEIVEAREPPVADLGALITGAESSLPAHERAHTLFRRARAHRIPTLSFQHGVENVGLVHLAHEQGDPPAILSDHFLCWAGPGAVPPTATVNLRPRLVHTGRVIVEPRKIEEVKATLLGFESVAVVFENLHWDRYDADWRRRFLMDCVEFAQADSARAVVLKPHHGGLWTVRNLHLAPSLPSNLVLADPTDSFWEPFTAPSLLRIADWVITTPSTVALDAIQAGKPVAVAAYGLDLPAYAPLPMLNDLHDWISFAASKGDITDAKRRAEFLSRTVTGECAAKSAAAYVVEVMRERAAARREVV